MKKYADIYGAFEPIFQWIQTHYPSGGFFIVDSDSAKFYAGSSTISVFSERVKAPLSDNADFQDGFIDYAKQLITVIKEKAEATAEGGK